MKLGPLEERVMEIIWKHKEDVKVKDVWEKFGGKYAYTTILTIFQHLERKGFIKGEIKGKVKHYRVIIDRNKYLKHRMYKALREVIAKHPDAAYMFFVEDAGLSDEDVKKILERLKE